jgi:hypothetical protein
MNKAEILEELPKLSPFELCEIQDRIFQLEEESFSRAARNRLKKRKRCSIAN